MEAKVKKVPVRIVNENGHRHDGVDYAKGDVISVHPDIAKMLTNADPEIPGHKAAAELINVSSTASA